MASREAKRARLDSGATGSSSTASTDTSPSEPAVSARAARPIVDPDAEMAEDAGGEEVEDSIITEEMKAEEEKCARASIAARAALPSIPAHPDSGRIPARP